MSSKPCGCKICKYSRPPIHWKVVQRHIRAYGLDSNTGNIDVDDSDSVQSVDTNTQLDKKKADSESDDCESVQYVNIDSEQDDCSSDM